MKNTFKQMLLTLGIATALTAGPVVYTQNFETDSAGFSGSGAVQSAGTMPGFGASQWRNDTTGITTLTLTGLASHSQIFLNFDLALWDSIDIGSDHFIIQLDGNDLYNSSTDFGNYYPGDNISHGPGTQYTAAFTSFGVPDYGYNSFRDAGRNVSFQNIAHTGSTATFTFQFPNSQGGADESFGLDNFSISTDAAVSGVPEPSTIFLSLTGLGAAFLFRKRVI